MPGVTIGDNVVIGAGSVVTKNKSAVSRCIDDLIKANGDSCWDINNSCSYKSSGEMVFSWPEGYPAA